MVAFGGGSPLGLSGATAASRYVGATASGAPATGSFLLGDFIIDQSGSMWVCTVAGSPGTWVQVGGAGAGPMTTLGDMIRGGASGVATRLAVGSTDNVLGVAAGIPAWQLGMSQKAVTPVAGVALVNGALTILTWTPPNDGAMHRAIVILAQNVSSLETGGGVDLNFTAPSGNARSFNKFAGGLGTGDLSTFDGINAQANTAVSVVQHAALTGGAAKIWGEIWGS